MTIGSYAWASAVKRIVPSEAEKIDDWLTNAELDTYKQGFWTYDVCRNGCEGFQTVYGWHNGFLPSNEFGDFPEGSFLGANYRYVPIQSYGYSASWDSLNCVLFDNVVNMTSDYGPRGEGFHGGIDFGLYGGTNVYSPVNGEVVYADFYGDWGNTLIVENNNYLFMFSHARSFEVEVGDVVSAGDVVIQSGGADGDLIFGTDVVDGLVVKTAKYDWNLNGNSTGGHLHFEVRSCDEEGNCSETIHPNEAFQMIDAFNNCNIYDDYRGTSQDLHYVPTAAEVESGGW
jgi:murein DD-endopeptidase MepM/ murein hydrolase activator NlpD